MMDCSALPTSGQEDHITDDMLDLYMAEALASEMPSDVFSNAGRGRNRLVSNTASTSFSLRHNSAVPFALGTVRNAESGRVDCLSSSSLMGLDSMENIVLQRQSRRTSVQQQPLLNDASRSDITSDDSGDFAFFTADVRDAAAYDTIRDYMVYCKQQERDLQELEEECARLEAEQQALYGTAVAVNMTRRGSGVFPGIGGGASGGSKGTPSPSANNGHLFSAGDAAAMAAGPSPSVAEEFGEEEIDPLDACPYNDSRSNNNNATKGRSLYRYGEPDVPGDYSPVFKSGFLYRCATPEGMWVFYNDSQKYTMQVRYIFGASSTLAAGPHATLKRLPSGEIEIAVTVWPQETEVLLEGEVNGFKNLSVATPVDASYGNPHTAASTNGARALLARCAHQCGKSAVSLLTTEDVLEYCYELSADVQDGAPPQRLDSTRNGSTTGNTSTTNSSYRTRGSVSSTAGSGAAHFFVDPAFPPCTTSLYRHGVDDLFLWDMPWRVPAEYLPRRQASEVCLFVHAALPTDPCTGDGGDAYLCSAASLLAEHAEMVYRLFRHPTSPLQGQQERRVGAFSVTLSSGGWWTHTVVDSYLPASWKGPDLGRSAHDLRKLWYPLLEKAYAKLHGSYAAIQCGDPLEALQDFTGFPTFRFDEEWAEVAEEVRGSLSCFSNTPETEQLFAMLEEKVMRCGYLVCLSLPDEGPAESKEVHMGMVYGMSYAVLRMVRYEDYRLVQVRCPTMRLDGDGLWCAESVRWRQEPELAQLCGMTPRPASADGENATTTTTAAAAGGVGFDAGSSTPGGLWLDWSEALLMFEGGGVCCVQRGWTEDCRVRGTFHDGVPSLALEVRVDLVGDGAAASPVEAYCILSQEDDRGLPPDYPNRVLQPLMLCVSSAADGNDEVSYTETSPTTQCVRLACSTDPDAPTDQLSYILGRDIALRTTFQPSKHPYYVVPRCLGEMANKLFTVGFVSSERVTKTGRLRVRAVELPAKSPLFKNQRIFCTKQVTNVAAASFQLRGADGRVHVGCGSSIG
uniref:Putative calpain-like cysteine peptidase n=1 Tax=Angomonas deanei TaxID=59799 RepID=C6K3U8_9TRYP|nr:putative calpain-like cysteine peptidase [Angomonas deanei]